MTWFKVDDTLFLHPKVSRAGNRAMGLWVRAGAWSSSLLTEGFIPAHMIATLGGTAGDARRLVDAGLWDHDTQDGAAGYRFHEWLERNPSREQVDKDRAAARERQRRAREAAAERRKKEAKDKEPDGTNVTHLSRRDNG